MPFPIQNITVVKQGLGLLIEQYKESPLFQQLLTSYLVQVQDLSDVIWEVIRERYLADAVGVQLDVLGGIVGLAREGLSDALYSAALNVQIRINRSFGTPVDILEVSRLVLGPVFPTILYSERQPATIILQLAQVLTDTERFTLVRSLFGTKLAGVKLWIFESDPNSFLFKTVGGADDPNRGFTSVNGGAGGTLAHVFNI